MNTNLRTIWKGAYVYFFTHAKHTWSIQDSVIIFNTPVENVTGMCKDPGIVAS